MAGFDPIPYDCEVAKELVSFLEDKFGESNVYTHKDAIYVDNDANHTGYKITLCESSYY